jgi:hypothetical protein
MGKMGKRKALGGWFQHRRAVSLAGELGEFSNLGVVSPAVGSASAVGLGE